MNGDEKWLAMLAKAHYAETGGTLVMYTDLRWLINRVQQAEAALAEIEAKPYRAEEVTARYRRETR